MAYEWSYNYIDSDMYNLEGTAGGLQSAMSVVLVVQSQSRRGFPIRVDVLRVMV